MIREKVHELLNLVQLDWLGDRYPHQLSGGQRQRIALARALAIEPKVLLLDEPFGALDAKVRKDLRRWLRRLHDDIQLTSVFVTHDQEEALEVADRVVLFDHGRVEQVGEPDAVYDHPATSFVYGFLGHANRVASRVERGRATIGRATVAVPEHAGVDGAVGTAYIRPHDLEIVDDAADAAFTGDRRARRQARLRRPSRAGRRVRRQAARGRAAARTLRRARAAASPRRRRHDPARRASREGLHRRRREERGDRMTASRSTLR